MAEERVDIVRPVEGLKSLAGINPLERQKKRQQRQQQQQSKDNYEPEQHAKTQQDQKQKDSDHLIDFRA